VPKLSPMALSLWAKKSKDGSLSWLPLATHMVDSAAVAQKLWNRWLSSGAKMAINAGIEPQEGAERLFVFLSAVHDLGKATPVFQAKKSACNAMDQSTVDRILKTGLPMKPASYFESASKTPHALATQVLLEYAKCDKRIAVILGSHHGKPPDNNTLNTCGRGAYPENFHLGKEGKLAWDAVQHELLNFALELSGYSSVKAIPQPNMAAQVLLSGLVIMADWVASSESCFPYMSLDDAHATDTRSRVAFAWESLQLPYLWYADNLWMRSNLYLSVSTM